MVLCSGYPKTAGFKVKCPAEERAHNFEFNLRHIDLF